ncbi:hypothetical protein GDO81_018823 [Engystomops pustulosus]|uniref:Uncharacterized protein n=1 Tax=Engystomops pustulosus TaxID=76066 RepID=A0AAV6YLH3_ENGPU|nr:hypothetical protein GDO81_018828 [Engystomops pustulosus]KAG8534689.1 hypothetical protein GDO81_018823 [Engystomops pustulosus]
MTYQGGRSGRAGGTLLRRTELGRGDGDPAGSQSVRRTQSVTAQAVEPGERERAFWKSVADPPDTRPAPAPVVPARAAMAPVLCPPLC